jgi:hypothetical protein
VDAMAERFERGKAQVTDIGGEADTFFLVHSPLVGPFTWRPAQRELQARGQRAIVPSLLEVLEDSSGFAGAVAETVERQVRERAHSGDLYLVLHSAAGAFAGAVREGVSAPVAGYVFVDARLPEDGVSLSAQDADEAVRERRAMAREGMLPPWSAWYSPDVIAQVLPDPEVRSLFVSELRPIPLGLFEEPLQVASGWPDAPCGYVQLSEFYQPQAEAARAAGWPVIEAELGHLHMLVRPGEVVDLILGMADRLKG